MKKFLIVLMFVCGSANASEDCDLSGRFAESVMTFKYDGASIQESKIALKRAMNNDETMKDMLMAVIDWAYARPNQKNIEKEIKDFRDIVKETCDDVYNEYH